MAATWKNADAFTFGNELPVYTLQKLQLHTGCVPDLWLLLFSFMHHPAAAAQPSWRSDTKLRSDPC